MKFIFLSAIHVQEWGIGVCPLQWGLGIEVGYKGDMIEGLLLKRVNIFLLSYSVFCVIYNSFF